MAEPPAPIGVSIVTVALNAARDLPLTLESVVGQDYPHLQRIVVDALSWDGSAEVLRRYAGAVDTIVQRADAGTYYAMNDALEHVTGDYVIFVNAGDLLYAADAISRAVAALAGRPDIFYGDHLYADGRVETFRRSAPFAQIGGRLARGDVDHRWHESIPCHQATFTRADLLRRLRYDTRLRIAADHDLLFRAHAEGAVLQYVGETIAIYRGGGMSATQGDRCTLENVATYRRFTTRPAAVDRLFYPDGAPFPPRNAQNGIVLSGLIAPALLPPPVAGAAVGDWVSGAGCVLLSPRAESSALAIAGFNALADQRADLLVDDAGIGALDLPVGEFDVEIPFDRPLAGGSLVTLLPSRFGASYGATDIVLALALRDVRFTTAASRPMSALSRGMRVGAGDEAFAEMLGAGWSQPEPSHIWSLGRQSELWLLAGEETRRLRLAVSGNPHVAHGQQLTVRVNGRPVSATPLPAHVDTTIEIDCASDAWRAGTLNRVSLCPSASASCAGDARDMGVCLKYVEAG